MIQSPDIAKIANAVNGRPLTPNRGGYTVTMREDPGTDEVLQRLAADEPQPGRMHLGWGSFRNLDIVAARRSSCAFICDLNYHQLTVWHTLAETIIDCATAEELVDRLVSVLPDEPRLRRFADSIEEWLAADLDRAESWLGTNNRDRFSYIRNLFCHGAIGIACLDICRCDSHPGQTGRPGFTRLASAIRQLESSQGIFPDTLYLSNIPYMLRNNSGFFGKLEWQWVSGAHDGSCMISGETAQQMMWDNLQGIVGPMTLTVQAGQLAEGFTDKDPQWQTTVNTFAKSNGQISP